MKKMIFSVALLVFAYTLFAQEVTVYRLANSKNATLTVPLHIKTSFEKEYPGITVITWEPVNAYWRASYNMNNRVVYVLYDDRGLNYRVALPVIENSIPEDVVKTALNLYGPAVYGIMKMKSADNTDVYHVRILDNGATRSVWMDMNGVTVTNIFKAKTEEGTMITKLNE